MDALRVLQHAARCQFSLLAAREKQIRNPQEGFGEIAKREWLDRIESGPGCWETASNGDTVSGTSTPPAGM